MRFFIIHFLSLIFSNAMPLNSPVCGAVALCVSCFCSGVLSLPSAAVSGAIAVLTGCVGLGVSPLPNHTHTVNIPSHNHSFSLSPHSHGFTIRGHSHDVTVPAHAHDITPGIYTFGNPQRFGLYVNGTKKADFEGRTAELDITKLLVGDNGMIPRGSWLSLEVRPNDLAYVSMDLIVQGFVQSRGDNTV